ncbi:hypothetical protein PM082_005843 [Marasmius tenuissimus]|nr:hypothetical protein PM082_005843 [Marasmius tenuissimus]
MPSTSSTPDRKQRPNDLVTPSPTTLRSPAQANKQTLAKDILRALGKRSRSSENLVPPVSKRQATTTPTSSTSQATPTTDRIATTPSKPTTLSSSSSKEPDNEPPKSVGNGQVTPSPATATARSTSDQPGDQSVKGMQPRSSPKRPEPSTSTVLDAATRTSHSPNPTLAVPKGETVSVMTSESSTTAVQSTSLPDPPLSQSLRVGTPLFLPSPDLATIQAASPVDVISITDSPPKKRVMRMKCVEIPPSPAYIREDVRRAKQARAREKAEYLFDQDHEAAQTALAALVEGAYAIAPSTPTPKRTERDPAEEAVMKDATTRLQSSPCRWQSCDATLNSVARLERHLKEHIENLTDNELITCLWQTCRHTESEKSQLVSHVLQHTRSFVSCPYRGCQDSFRTPRQLLEHSRGHSNDSVLKTSADPSAPSILPLPDCPDVLPSYMVVARHVSPHPMTREEHQAASVTVLKRIMPPTHAVFGHDRSPLRRRDAQPALPLDDDYDFVAYRPSPSCRPSCAAKIRSMPDLKSSRISELIHGGLTLW